MDRWTWPRTADELVAVQLELAAAARGAPPWVYEAGALVGGCFVAYARGDAGPGHPGDRAWAAAVVWSGSADAVRRGDRMLRGRGKEHEPRRARDVDAQAIVADRVPAAYEPGFLALREGPILAAAVNALDERPDVLLVDATGLDHPRRAGVALHLGGVTDIPTVGVTHRALVARAELPPMERGAWTEATLDDGTVAGRWVCTRTGVRPVLAHAAWRTDAATAAAVVLAASTEGARAPVPLQEARRVAREARALAGAG